MTGLSTHSSFLKSSVDSVEASAPSNIALIKYMGKTDEKNNQPTNGSLSYTLEHLRTFVRITPLHGSDQDQWKLFVRADLMPMELSGKGQERFLNHFKKMKSLWNIEGFFLIESANNFPSDCGLASSASSFAALTMAAAKMFQKLNSQPNGDDARKLSAISRQGSGSSCRSFFSPWALWQDEAAEPLALEFPYLLHLVVIVEEGKKEVSSSQAHRLVTSSPRFSGRVERAETRLKDLIHALRYKDWSMAFQICWDEFIDMHRLFETSEPSFSYMTEDSKFVIDECRKMFTSKDDAPLVTMDAGANVHLLFRPDQLEIFTSLETRFKQKFKVLSSPLKPGVQHAE